MIIKYRRQINPVEYEVEEVALEIEINELDDTLVAQTFSDLKAHALRQLGLEYYMDQTGVIREVREQVSQERPVRPFEPPIETYSDPYQPDSIPPAPVQNEQVCYKCGGPVWDNRVDNDERRAHGYRLGPELKCKDPGCGTATWPKDFEKFKHLPKQPRR
jgi:hypothetical protein